MTTVIRGIPVKFPFTPYDIQKNYMEKVIDCLEHKQNGILESPTGTGKTLSLLCSALAWLEKRKIEFQSQEFKDVEEGDSEDDTPSDRKVPTIVYASRTHSQLYQAMQEMKTTSYNHMRACVLGSREQMCINEEVIEEKDTSLKLNLCRAKVKNRSCGYHRNVEKKVGIEELEEKAIVDMEDIVEMGRCHGFCPYFMARELKLRADIVFMPYNYLMDQRTTKTLGVNFANCAIILDEAHNIEKVCEDSASCQITTTNLDTCIEDIKALIDILIEGHIPEDEEITFTPNQLRQLNEIFIKFIKALNDINLPVLGSGGLSLDGDHIFQMLETAGVTIGNYNSVTDLLDQITQFLSTTKSTHRRGFDLNIFSELLYIVFYNPTPESRQKIKECFKVHVADEEPKRRFGGDWLSQATPRQKNRVLNFWCFSPGFAMKMLMDQGVHCVILTSGTLAPLKPLISELEIDIGVKIENPHVIKGDQICVKVLPKGPDSEPLISNYQNRNNPKYLQSLGMTISNLIRIIPHGVLIFFPSYFIMTKCQEYWEENGIWDRINEIKPIYVEPRDKISFKEAMHDYYSKIKDPKYEGAIFMGVCRGKISEGLDFADGNGRAVFITGLPYPPLKDARIVLKKQYLDVCNSKDREYIRGDEWYNLEATRAVNQAIGRVIRHKDDYGAIILLDARFSNPRIKSNMSRWLQQHITDMKNFGEIVRNLRTFFINAKENLPPPKIREKIEFEKDWATDSLECTSSVADDSNLVNIHKRRRDYNTRSQKRLK